MLDSPFVLNENEARRARATVAKIDDRLSGVAALNSARSGLPTNVVDHHRKALSTLRVAITQTLESYERARQGDFKDLLNSWRGEPGVVLIVARIARRMSQLELANKLNMREQQIQRYETERYRSISLQNYRRIAAALGVEVIAQIQQESNSWLRQISVDDTQFSAEQVKKVIHHAKTQKWFDAPKTPEEQPSFLAEYINETNARFGSPALLRTGLNVLDLKEDLLLASWRARIVQRARLEAAELKNAFSPLDIGWLRSLVSLSVHSDGPKRAKAMLREQGICLIAEPQITGLRLDGAALQIEGIPVIGMTIRHDRVDNFWFTLLHEIAHVFLHHQSGLSAGFLDDLDAEQPDGLELEANDFASSLLIAPERWRASPARITNSASAVCAFAAQLNVHPAILFGRIRKERNDYSIFSDRIGTGQVKKYLMPH